MTRGRTIRRRLPARLLAMLGGLTITLLLLEVGARVLGLDPVPHTTGEGEDTMKVADETLLFVNKPNSRSELTYVRTSDGTPYTVVHSSNSLGLRGPETTREKPGGVLRIACLGDSFTYGYGVNDDETWPAALQRALDAHAAATPGAPRYEVLNFGVPAYDTEQEVQLLRQRVLLFEPDLVLVAWYLNDPAVRDGAAGSAIEGPPATVRWLSPKAEGVLATLRDWSQALDFVCDRIYRRSYQQYHSVAFASLYDDVHPGWRRAKLALQRGFGLCKQRGIPFAVVMYPDLTRDGGHLVTHEPYAKLAAWCAEQGIACLDLEPVFAPRDLDALRVHVYDSHPNGEAHELVGRRVAGWLEESDLLPR